MDEQFVPIQVCQNLLGLSHYRFQMLTRGASYKQLRDEIRGGFTNTRHLGSNTRWLTEICCTCVVNINICRLVKNLGYVGGGVTHAHHFSAASRTPSSFGFMRFSWRNMHPAIITGIIVGKCTPLTLHTVRQVDIVTNGTLLWTEGLWMTTHFSTGYKEISSICKSSLGI